MCGPNRLGRSRVLGSILCAGLLLALPAAALADAEHPLLAIMQDELEQSMEQLVGPDGTRAYFLQYAITDEKGVNVSASLRKALIPINPFLPNPVTDAIRSSLPSLFMSARATEG